MSGDLVYGWRGWLWWAVDHVIYVATVLASDWIIRDGRRGWVRLPGRWEYDRS